MFRGFFDFNKFIDLLILNVWFKTMKTLAFRNT